MFVYFILFYLVFMAVALWFIFWHYRPSFRFGLARKQTDVILSDGFFSVLVVVSWLDVTKS